MSYAVLKENTITFKRINSANITGYEIYAKEYLANNIVTRKLIATLPNIQVDDVDDSLVCIHNATNKTDYIVTPLVDYSNTIGEHNVIM